MKNLPATSPLLPIDCCNLPCNHTISKEIMSFFASWRHPFSFILVSQWFQRISLKKKKQKRYIHPFMQSLFITGNELYVRPTDKDDHSSMANESQGEWASWDRRLYFLWYSSIIGSWTAPKSSFKSLSRCMHKRECGQLHCGGDKNSTAQCLQ